MSEEKFVTEALEIAKNILQPISLSLVVKKGAALLYQITLNENLEIRINLREPKRGQSAFQTDLCIFEEISEEIRIPRVVLEFKVGLSTHDVITYSTKARKHKQIYPYLRYGLIVREELTIPGRFFTHNEALDFCVAAAAYEGNLSEILKLILPEEVEASRRLQDIAFGKISAKIFREEIILL